MSARDLRATVERLSARKLSDAEFERLDRIRRELGIADTDALWGVYAMAAMMRGQVEDFARDLPLKLGNQVTKVLEQARNAALDQAVAYEKTVEAKLAEARREGKQEGAREEKERQRKKEGGGALRTAMRLAIVLVAAAALYMVDQYGFERGVRRSHWADTPEGQAAWKFHQAGWVAWLETDAGKAVAKMVADGRAGWLGKVNGRKMSQWDIDTVHKLMACESTSPNKRILWTERVHQGRLYCETSGGAVWRLPQ